MYFTNNFLMIQLLLIILSSSCSTSEKNKKNEVQIQEQGSGIVKNDTIFDGTGLKDYVYVVRI